VDVERGVVGRALRDKLTYEKTKYEKTKYEKAKSECKTDELLRGSGKCRHAKRVQAESQSMGRVIARPQRQHPGLWKSFWPLADELAPQHVITDEGTGGKCGPNSLSRTAREKHLYTNSGDHLRQDVCRHGSQLLTIDHTWVGGAGKPYTVRQLIEESFMQWSRDAYDGSAETWLRLMSDEKANTWVDTAFLALTADFLAVDIRYHAVIYGGKYSHSSTLTPSASVVARDTLTLALVIDWHFCAVLRSTAVAGETKLADLAWAEQPPCQLRQKPKIDTALIPTASQLAILLQYSEEEARHQDTATRDDKEFDAVMLTIIESLDSTPTEVTLAMMTLSTEEAQDEEDSCINYAMAESLAIAASLEEAAVVSRNSETSTVFRNDDMVLSMVEAHAEDESRIDSAVAQSLMMATSLEETAVVSQNTDAPTVVGGDDMILSGSDFDENDNDDMMLEDDEMAEEYSGRIDLSLGARHPDNLRSLSPQDGDDLILVANLMSDGEIHTDDDEPPLSRRTLKEHELRNWVIVERVLAQWLQNGTGQLAQSFRVHMASCAVDVHSEIGLEEALMVLHSVSHTEPRHSNGFTIAMLARRLESSFSIGTATINVDRLARELHTRTISPLRGSGNDRGSWTCTDEGGACIRWQHRVHVELTVDVERGVVGRALHDKLTYEKTKYDKKAKSEGEANTPPQKTKNKKPTITRMRATSRANETEVQRSKRVRDEAGSRADRLRGDRQRDCDRARLARVSICADRRITDDALWPPPPSPLAVTDSERLNEYYKVLHAMCNGTKSFRPHTCA
jgi:hypothetical protein